MSLILSTDSYKLTHWKFYPKNTQYIYSYFECRKGGMYEKTVFYGLQIYLNILSNLVKEFHKNPKGYIQEAEDFCNLHFGNKEVFNKEGWRKLAQLGELHGQDYLPIKIKAVKEGSLVKEGNVLFTIENTNPDFYWLTNHLETLLMKVWSPITIATNSYYLKDLIKHHLKLSRQDENLAGFMMHDFGYRGVSSEETAGILGSAHLTSFKGSDTIAGIITGLNNYDFSSTKMQVLPPDEMLGYSVPATEHSIATAFGQNEKEYLLTCMNAYPEGIISVVIDSYNALGFTDMVCNDPEVREKVLSRKGKLVLRPDSGDPVQVTSTIVEKLWNAYGGTYTSTNHKQLIPQIGILQGDGIDFMTTSDILNTFRSKGYAAGNIVFGSGGGLLQKFNRDTQRCAIKASCAIIDDKEVNLVKNPSTDQTKASKKGRLKLIKGAFNEYSTISSFNMDSNLFNGYVDELELVYSDGKIVRQQSFDEIRERLNSF